MENNPSKRSRGRGGRKAVPPADQDSSGGPPQKNSGPGVPQKNSGPGVPQKNSGPGVPQKNSGSGVPQKNSGPGVPKVLNTQKNSGPVQPNVSWPQKSKGSNSQPQLKTTGVMANRPTSGLPKQLEQVTNGVNKMAVFDAAQALPLGRGAVRDRGAVHDRREVNCITAERPESSLGSKEGTSGTKIPLFCNYFPITSCTDWTLFQYRIDFNPDEEHPFVRRGLMSAHSAMLKPYIFDGTVLYCSTKFEKENFELVSKRKFDDQIVIINVSYVRAIHKNDYTNIQIFNLLMKSCLRNLNLKLIGRNYYDNTAKIDIPKHNLQIWPGYETTINMFDSGLMLRTEISSKIMRQETAYSFLINCMKSKDGFNVFKQTILGTIVLTAYNNQTYRIHDVDGNANPNSTFDTKDGSKMTFVKYYKEKWGLTIKDPKQPMLLSKNKRTFANMDKEDDLIYLVPELCLLTGLTDSMRNNFTLMKDMADFTQVNPSNRVTRYNKFMDRLQTTPKCLDVFKTWNLTLGTELAQLQGRTLPFENINPNISAKKTYNTGPNADWSSSVRDLPMYTCASIKLWYVVYTQSTNDTTLYIFLETLQQVAKKMNFVLPVPKLIRLADTSVNAYLRELENCCNRFNPSLILSVLPTNRSDFYTSIKKSLCVNRAVPSQVVLAKNVEKNNKSVCTKIAIQMNAKLGGAPWHVSIPLKGMMVIGFDVCHDKKKNISVGALVATINDSHSNYFSTVQQHSSGDELSNSIGLLVVLAARKYLVKNKVLPSCIIVYRDGVGDGMVQYVQKNEVANIKRLYKETFEKNVSMAFIIVKKRISSRFFVQTPQKNYVNPPPGTIIDTVVTDPLMYDFFLISQNTRFGTVTPTHYNVIYDCLTNWSPDRMQRLTYKLTHMYYNWSGTVRVPAPCQLAHKLAYLSAQIGNPNPGLNELLYFL